MNDLIKKTDTLTTAIPLVGVVVEMVLKYFDAPKEVAEFVLWLTVALMGYFTNKKEEK